MKKPVLVVLGVLPRFFYYLVVVLAVVSFGVEASYYGNINHNINKQINGGDTKTKTKIGLITASLPWTFGPYQAQMHHLSLLLANNDNNGDGAAAVEHGTVEYDVYWICNTETIPDGVYHTYQELRPYLKTNYNPPPEDFPLDHLTILGASMIGQSQFGASTINNLAYAYGLDMIVTLMDITRTEPDVPLKIPVLAWIPLHSQTISPSSVDYWVLRQYHGVAALAPSGATAIKDVVGPGKEIQLVEEEDETTTASTLDQGTIQIIQQLSGTVEVEFIPHIIERKELLARGNVGLHWIQQLPSIAHVDAHLTQKQFINRGQPSTLELGHPDQSLFGDDRKNDFIILLQGGNYDNEDRKGWDTSIQAFAKFYKSLDQESSLVQQQSGGGRVHLLLHSMESYLIAADQNGNEDAPSQLMPLGYNHRLALHKSGIPKDAYTIDIACHASEVIAAYKMRADVCLHPSKVEGFGMNVMECQAVGTPVITTNYTAMGDYTKLGRSVPPQQMITSPGSIYSMALPDVDGIAQALTDLYHEHLALQRRDHKLYKYLSNLRQRELEQSNQWIDTTFSSQAVGTAFRALLHRTQNEFNKRRSAEAQILNNPNVQGAGPPSVGAYKIASGYHLSIVDWDAPWTLIAPDGLQILNPGKTHGLCWSTLLMDDASGSSKSNTAIVLPAVYEDGRPVPFMNDDGDQIHEDLPVFIRTYILTAIQGQSTRRKSLIALVMQQSPQTRQFPTGLAVVVKDDTNNHNIRQQNHKQQQGGGGGGEWNDDYNSYNEL